MKSFDEYIKDLKKQEKKSYHNSLKIIDEKYGEYYIAYLIAKSWNASKPEDAEKAINTRGYVKITLGKQQNVAKDFMVFLDTVKTMIENKFGTKMETTSDDSSVDFRWYKNCKSLSIWVYYGGSHCSRKLIRTEQEVVSKPIYEIVCD